MYPVSEVFLNAVKANTRKYFWTGKITTTAGKVYEFDQEDMVKGSGYTIVTVADGAGAKKWGKLKSGIGWIALEYTKTL